MSAKAKEALIRIMYSRGWSAARAYVETCCDAELYELSIALLMADEIQADVVMS